jgi:hypothetical protein
MNPHIYMYGLIISGAAFALQLVWIVYFFGVFRGTFQEFKESTTASLKRLEGIFFTDVKIVPHPAGETAPAAEHTTAQRSKR